MHDYKKYKDYNELSLINDPFFQDYILNPTEERKNFWNRFVEIYPEKKQEVENAGIFLQKLEFVENEPDDALIQASLKQHLAYVAANNDDNVFRIDNKRRWVSYLRVAAVLLPVLLVGAAIFYSTNKRVVFSTALAKTDTLTLPDNSLVILNANSSVEYAKSFAKQKKREVWLKGEAFFEVKHLNENAKEVKQGELFVVHTEDVDVEVLGTMFNVRQRRGQTEVVLQSGSVKVIFKHNDHPPALLHPGNILIYDPENKQLTKSNVDAEAYTSWKEKKLILFNPTVNEIIAYFEDNFGAKITLQKPVMGSIIIEGPIKLNDLDDALFILSTALSAEVTRKDDEYIIRPR